mgnify:CR=1 FL=1
MASAPEIEPRWNIAPTQYVPVLDELPADQEAGKAQILAAWKETSDGLTTHLEGWRESELDTYQLPHLLFGMMNWIYTWYHPAGPTPPAALADELASLFLDGYIAAHHATPRLVATLGG